MATTRQIIKNDVYRRLGDLGFFESTPLPSAATEAAVEREIYQAIVALVIDMENLGVRPLNASGTLAIVSGTREYDLDATLANLSPAGSVYRAHLYIERTDLTNPIPVRWEADGDYRVRERSRGYYTWPDAGWQGVVPNTSDAPVLYRRGRAIGYHTTPTATQTLTCYFSSVVTDFANDSETLTTILLEDLEPWAGLISDKVALQLSADISSPLYPVIRDQYGEERARFLTSITQSQRVSGYPRQSRWTG